MRELNIRATVYVYMKLTACLLLMASACFAALDRIEVAERKPLVAGYEKITGTARFSLDPKLEANRIIVDLDRVPAGPDGKVHFKADLFVLKPEKGNGTALLEINNRGRKGLLSMFCFAPSSINPSAAADLGDQFLLEQGYTLIWLGWQFDVPDQPGLMRVHVPRVDGVKGLVRAEYIPTSRSETMPLAEREHLPYEVATEDGAALSVREKHIGARKTIPRSEWKFGPEGQITMAAGFEPGKIYELVFQAKNPAIVGLGPAGVRDLISHLKYEGDWNIRRAIGFGTSQSGRFLRTFVYQGFNSDEENRKVFDGVWPHVAGAGRGSFNFRFAQPSRDAQPFGNFFYPTDLFPFTDTGKPDESLLSKAEAKKVVPRIFYTNGAYEYWGRAASLIHTTPDGQRDVAPAPSTRIYFLTGAQHGPGSWPPGHSNTRYTHNPNDYRFEMRALLTAMQKWIADGVEPPASAYPLIAKDQLVSAASLNFPALPGISSPARIHTAYRVNYGPDFVSKGVITIEPPDVGQEYKALAPRLNADGNEVSGLQLPELLHPLGTYTGWSFRAAALGAPDEMIAFIGSFFPFAPTKAERVKNNDPRVSIVERYPTKAVYVSRIEGSAKDLVKSGYLLERDVPALVKRAGTMWDAVVAK